MSASISSGSCMETVYHACGACPSEMDISRDEDMTLLDMCQFDDEVKSLADSVDLNVGASRGTK